MKKQQKKKNPFKVDHVRSIKLKAKAKQYTGNLKQLKLAVADKVKSTNEQLSTLEDIVRQGTKKEVKSSNTVSSGTCEEDKKMLVEEFQKSQKSEADALDKLTSWTCKD